MEAMSQIDIQKVEMHTLIQKLEQTEDLKDATKKRNRALDLAQHRHEKSLSTEAHRRNKIRKQKLWISSSMDCRKLSNKDHLQNERPENRRLFLENFMETLSKY